MPPQDDQRHLQRHAPRPSASSGTSMCDGKRRGVTHRIDDRLETDNRWRMLLRVWPAAAQFRRLKLGAANRRALVRLSDRRTPPIVLWKCARTFRCLDEPQWCISILFDPRRGRMSGWEAPSAQCGNKGRSPRFWFEACECGRASLRKRPICVRPLEGGRPAHEAARRLPCGTPIEGSVR
jgi:hypothetical protein